MKISIGAFIIKNEKVLLVHPTNAPWTGQHSIPKGLKEKGENNKQTLLREIKEEVNIDLPKKGYDNYDGVVLYRKSDDSIRKKVFYYIIDANNMDIPEVLPKKDLQLEEVDDARFYTYKDAKKIIFWRLKPELEKLRIKGLI